MNQEEADVRDYAYLLARRMLGMTLRQHRVAAGLPMEQVAQQLMYSPSRISRVETGRTTINPRDVRDFGVLYKLSSETVADLQKLARSTRGRSEPEARVSIYVASVGISSEIASYRTHGIPSILWTSGYEALIGSAFPGQAEEFRRILTRAVPPDLMVVLHESTLYNLARVATDVNSEISGEQLLYVLELSRLPNVTIHVIQEDASFPEQNTDITYCTLADPKEMSASPGGSLLWQDASTEPELWSVDGEYDYRALTEKALSAIDSSLMIIDAAKKLVKV